MPAKVCPDCNVPWPSTVDYKTCPFCLVDTEYQSGRNAISKAKAESEVAHVKFERYYKAWEERREKQGEPSPEALGALEAKEILRLERIPEVEQ